MTNETKPMADEPKRRANSAYIYRVLDGKHEWDYGPIGKFVVDPDKIEASARHFLMNYGIKQWINDGAAETADKATGKVDPVAKYNGARERAELLNSGTPASGLLRRNAGPGKFSDVTRALVRLGTYAGVDVSTYDKANAYVKSIADSTDPKFAAMKFGGQVGKVRDWLAERSKTVKVMIETIKAEEAQNLPEVDADALLEEAKGA